MERRRTLYSKLETGYVCGYSEILLEVNKRDSGRGDYVSFDHAVPGHGNRAVLCSRIVNDLKGWMTDGEFCEFVKRAMDPSVDRSLHGIPEADSREYLTLLRRVMMQGEPKIELRIVRDRLKEISAQFRY